MAKANNYKPKDLHDLTTFLVVDDAAEFIKFLTKIGGEQTFVMKTPDGKVAHATVKIGDSNLMIGDTMDGMQPQVAMLYLYVKDIDAAFKKAVAAGGESVHEPADQYYGDRAGCVKDKWGNTWWFATWKEDVDQAELERRAVEAAKKEKEEVPQH